jgi:hypothetical protein
MCAVEMALDKVSALAPSDRVLVHAAAGGVGLAAIQVAQVSVRCPARHPPATAQVPPSFGKVLTLAPCSSRAGKGCCCGCHCWRGG